MCVATGLAYAIVPSFYLQETILIDSEQQMFPLEELPTLMKDLEIADIFIVYAWTAEFAVKLSLLVFFKKLVQRLPRLTLYVKLVMVVAIVVWAVPICEPWILCPHTESSGISMSALHCQYWIFYFTNSYL